MTLQFTAAALLADLQDVRRQLRDWSLSDTDVRLQVSQDGYGNLHSGDASYDTDHGGFWGEGMVTADDTDDDLRATARDLIDQVTDAAVEVAS